MKPQTPLSSPFRNTAGDPDRHGHRRGPFVSTCEAVVGYPNCIAAATGGAHGVDCTCPPFNLETLKPLTEQEHAACVREAWDAYRERNGSPCDDCAFRPGSPEMRDELALTVAVQQAPFRCHQGMPLQYVVRELDGSPKVSYKPNDAAASEYPVCNGWAYLKLVDDHDRAVDDLLDVIEAGRQDVSR